MDYSIKVRLEPTEEQVTIFKQHTGMRRYLYNLVLNYCKVNGFSSYIDLQNKLPTLKEDDKHQWLNECDSTSVQQAVKDLSTAYKNFFDSYNNTRKGRKMNPPKFKKKGKSKESFRILNTARVGRGSFELRSNGTLKVSKKAGKLIKVADGVKEYNRFMSLTNVPNSHPRHRRIKIITISQDSDGQWYASLCIELMAASKILNRYSKTGKTCGIDLGIRSSYTLVDSDNTIITNNIPATLAKLDKKLAKWQRIYDRLYQKAVERAGGTNFKLISTKNLAKAKAKISKIHYRIKQIRKNFLHQESHRIARDYDIVTMETLDIQKMMKNNKLAKDISNQGWYMFKTFIKYKLEWSGKRLIEVHKYFPSSQLCSCCKHQYKTLGSQTTWTCTNCGTHHSNRDINAATVLNKISSHKLANPNVVDITTLGQYLALV